MYNIIVVPSVLYRGETWEINACFGKKVDAFEMSCLRLIRGVTIRGRMRNNDNRT